MNQMETLGPEEFKIIILQEENPPEHDLKDDILHCPTTNACETILEENRSSRVTLACDNDTLIDVAPLLLENPNVDTLYVVTDRIDIMWPSELENGNFNWIQIRNKDQLMRHLYLKAMLCYFQQAEKHKKNGDYGVATRCFLDAKKALKQIEMLR